MTTGRINQVASRRTNRAAQRTRAVLAFLAMVCALTGATRLAPWQVLD